MKIALLGAGHIGQAIARLLVDSGYYEVTVVDQAASTLAQFANDKVRVAIADANSESALLTVLHEQDVVINALPYSLAVSVAARAREAGCHYFDLTEDVAATRAIRSIAQNACTVFMPQCGLAPGFIGIAAHHLLQSFDQVNELKLRVGALPVFTTNALKYNLTWSIDGLINEYCRPCEAIHEGTVRDMLPLEGLEQLVLDGVDYEAFNTSGGLGTLCETLAGRVRHLNYKTIRYPGHRDLMRFLLEDLQLKSDQEALKSILLRAIPTTAQDVVIVFILASGMKNGVFVQEVFMRKIFAETGRPNPLSAIQITTASGVCAAVDLLREGRLPLRGFVRQEQIDLPSLLANRFGAAYRLPKEPHKSNITFSLAVSEHTA